MVVTALAEAAAAAAKEAHASPVEAIATWPATAPPSNPGAELAPAAAAGATPAAPSTTKLGNVRKRLMPRGTAVGMRGASRMSPSHMSPTVVVGNSGVVEHLRDG